MHPKTDDMRIVLSHVYSWPEVRRGGERYMHELASALADAGHLVQIVSTATRPGVSNQLGVPVRLIRRRYPMPSRLGPCSDEMGFGMAAAAWAAPRGIDVWHALGTSDAATAALLGRLRRFKSVYTSLGVPDRWYRDSRPDRRLHELVVKRIDDYICLSESAGGALSQGWGRRPQILGGGVDTRRFAPGPRRHHHPALLYSGSFTEDRKNLPLLFEATAMLRKKRPDVVLWLSGSGELESKLQTAPTGAREAIVELGLGSVSDQANRYASAWVTVLPSDHEAFGLCLIESLACGTPIVVLAQSGGPAEIVRPGIGVASGKSASDLAEACELALELAALPDTSEACRAESQNYDWRRSIVPRLEQIYGG